MLIVANAMQRDSLVETVERAKGVSATPKNEEVLLACEEIKIIDRMWGSRRIMGDIDVAKQPLLKMEERSSDRDWNTMDWMDPDAFRRQMGRCEREGTHFRNPARRGGTVIQNEAGVRGKNKEIEPLEMSGIVEYEKTKSARARVKGRKRHL